MKARTARSRSRKGTIATPARAGPCHRHLLRVLLFLLTPAFVAWAITDEKSRGTLQYLLTSSLTTWEIVVGKLLGRLVHLGLLALAALPLFALMAPFGEFDLLTMAAVAVR